MAAVSSIFQKIHDKASRGGTDKMTRAKSRDWFIQNLKNIRNISRTNILNDSKLVARKTPLIGRMFMFFYDPKTKETLPYYDEFPLVVMVEPALGGFYGLNLHYLSPKLRAVFFDELTERLNNEKYDETTRIKLTYDMLKSTRKMRLFAPCFKRYLFKNISSKTVEVPPSEWEIAMFLPTDSFVGKDRTSVWNISKTFLNS
jgi:hypothetical protein